MIEHKTQDAIRFQPKTMIGRNKDFQGYPHTEIADKFMIESRTQNAIQLRLKTKIGKLKKKNFESHIPHIQMVLCRVSFMVYLPLSENNSKRKKIFSI